MVKSILKLARTIVCLSQALRSTGIWFFFYLFPKFEKERDSRKEQLMDDNVKEDRMLKQLEKNLRLNKRKSKNLPQAFVNDGLDCILP